MCVKPNRWVVSGLLSFSVLLSQSQGAFSSAWAGCDDNLVTALDPLRMTGTEPNLPWSKYTVENLKLLIKEAQKRQEITFKEIVSDQNPATFENTIGMLEKASHELDLYFTVLYHLDSTHQTEKTRKAIEELEPRFEKISQEQIQSRKLYARLKEVRDSNGYKKLKDEEKRALRDMIETVEENGLGMTDAQKKKLEEIRKELSETSRKYEKNISDLQSKLVVTAQAAEIEGVPDDLKKVFAANAKKKGLDAPYAIGALGSAYISVMESGVNRELRKKVWEMVSKVGVEKPYDNLENVQKILKLRAQLAELKGFKNFAEMQIRGRMATGPEDAIRFEKSLQDGLSGAVKDRYQELVEFARKDTGQSDFEIKPWDLMYYLKKIKMAETGFDLDSVKPYFELEGTLSRFFEFLNKQWGIEFRPLPVGANEPDGVRHYEVWDSKAGKKVGFFSYDLYAGEGKRGGAWHMGISRQSSSGGIDRLGLSANVLNIEKGAPGEPTLVKFDEVRTLLHEMGHALHNLFSQVRTTMFSGTQVAKDFVEVPSTFMEKFLAQPAFLQFIGRHYQTGEMLPDSMIEKILRKNRFGVITAFKQAGYSMLDLALHTLNESEVPKTYEELTAFESRVRGVDLTSVDGISNAYFSPMSPNFSHLFTIGYAAGYYSYDWSTASSFDAFSEFKNGGVFNPRIASRWRRSVLSRGDSRDPSVSMLEFLGRPLDPTAYLRSLGIEL